METANPEKTPARATRMAPEERRAKLIKSVLRVFATRGIGEARHAQVAEEAGVSLSTVFVYFPTREALVEAALGETGRFFVELAERIHSRNLPAPQLIAEHARAFADLVDESPEYVSIFLNWSSAVGQPYWESYLEAHAATAKILTATIERGKKEKTIAPDVNAADAAEILIGAAHILAQMKFMGKDQSVIDGFIASMARSAMGT